MKCVCGFDGKISDNFFPDFSKDSFTPLNLVACVPRHDAQSDDVSQAPLPLKAFVCPVCKTLKIF